MTMHVIAARVYTAGALMEAPQVDEPPGLCLEEGGT